MRFVLPIVIILVSLSYSLFRISHPLENRAPIDRITSNESDQNDDLVTYYTSKNFLEEGLLKNYYLPNRKGSVSLSFWGIPCHGAKGEEIKTFDLDGKELEVYSKENDCVYTRLPPLPDILFYLYSKVAGLSFTKLKVFAVVFKHISVALLFIFLVKVFSFWPALLSTTLYLASFYFQGWSASLYHQTFQFLLINALLLNYVSLRSSILSFVIALLLSLTTYEFLLFVPLAYFGISLVKRKIELKSSLFLSYFLGTSLGVVLHVFQNYLYFGSMDLVLKDFFNTVSIRYADSGISLIESIKTLTWYFDEYFLGIYLPLVLLGILILKSLVNRDKTYFGYILLFLSSISIVFYIPAYALKHFHHFFHHFYLLIFIAFADFFKSFFRQKGLAFIALIVFTGSLYLNSEMLVRDFNFIQDQHENYQESNLINNLDFIHLYQNDFSENKWIMYTSKYSLVDNVLKKRHSYRKRRQNIVLSKESNSFEIVLFFRNIAAMSVVKFQADSFSDSICRFYNEQTKDLKEVEVKIRKEESGGWHIFEFEQIETDVMKIKCDDVKGSVIYELQVF